MYLNSSRPWLTTTCTLYTGESCSLLRAQTDSIDLYQVHWPDRYVPMFGETDYDPASQYYFIQFLGRVVDAGKIRFIGVSNETPYGVMKFLQAAEKNPAYSRIISVQNSYNLLCRNFDSGLAECCHLERGRYSEGESRYSFSNSQLEKLLKEFQSFYYITLHLM
ncbi:putative D-xylose reductase [Helianthus annuus]|nr:putative D-xylose reductase [Helianthus annuus]